MAASSADHIVRLEGEQQGFIIEGVASATIYAGDLVCFDTDGLLVKATDAASLVPIGIAKEGGLVNETIPVVSNVGVRILKDTAATTDIGTPAYVLYDNEVAVTSTNYNYVGAIYKIESSTHVWVWVNYNANQLAMTVYALSDRPD